MRCLHYDLIGALFAFWSTIVSILLQTSLCARRFTLFTLLLLYLEFWINIRSYSLERIKRFVFGWSCKRRNLPPVIWRKLIFHFPWYIYARKTVRQLTDRQRTDQTAGPKGRQGSSSYVRHWYDKDSIICVLHVAKELWRGSQCALSCSSTRASFGRLLSMAHRYSSTYIRRPSRSCNRYRTDYSPPKYSELKAEVHKKFHKKLEFPTITEFITRRHVKFFHSLQHHINPLFTEVVPGPLPTFLPRRWLMSPRTYRYSGTLQFQHLVHTQ